MPEYPAPVVSRLRHRVVGLAALAGLLAVGPASADRVLLTGEGLQVVVPDSKVWCGPRAAVVVRGASASDFADERRLQKLLGGVRAALTFECPAAQAITLVGTVGATTDIAYKATATAQNGWRLTAEGIAPRPPAAATAPTPPVARVEPVPVQPPSGSPSPAPRTAVVRRLAGRMEPVAPTPLPPPPVAQSRGSPMGSAGIVALLAVAAAVAAFLWRRRRRKPPPLQAPPRPPAPPVQRVPSQPPAPAVATTAAPPSPPVAPVNTGASRKAQLFAEQRAKYQASITAAMDALTQTQLALQQRVGVPAQIREVLRHLATTLRTAVRDQIRSQHAGLGKILAGALLLKPCYRFFRRLSILGKTLAILGLIYLVNQLLGLAAHGQAAGVLEIYLLLAGVAFYFERRFRLHGPLLALERSAGNLQQLLVAYLYADQVAQAEKGGSVLQAVKVASKEEQPVAGDLRVPVTAFNGAAAPGLCMFGVADVATWRIGQDAEPTLIAATADNAFARDYAPMLTAAVVANAASIGQALEALREFGDLRWLEQRQRADVPRIEALLKNLQRLEDLWADVATEDKVFEFLLRRIDLFNLRDPAAPAGLLLSGYPGNGKEFLARRVAESVFAKFQSVAAADLATPREVKEFWDRHRGKGPVVLFVDRADQLFAKAGSQDAGGGTRDATLAWLEEWGREDAARSGVWVVMTAQDEKALNPRVLAQFGSSRIEIAPPGATGRELILRLGCTEGRLPPAVPAWVVEQTAGASVVELREIVRETRLHSVPNSPTDEHWRAAIGSVRGADQAIRDPSRTWERLVLPAEVKEKLQRAAKILREGEKYQEKGVKVPNVLLVGPPGTGKTDIARTFANEGGVRFIMAQTADLIPKYEGQGAHGVREVFAKARASAPCILFIDEMETVAPKRDAPGARDYTQQIVTQLLQEMEGVAKADRPVFVLAATNLPQDIDKAVLDRFTSVIEIPLPDENARREILLRLLHEKPVDPALDLDEVAAVLAKRLPRRSGRALVMLVNRALERAVSQSDSPEDVRLTRALLLGEVNPAGREVPPEELAKIWDKVVLKPDVKALILGKIRLFNQGDKKAPKGLLLYGPSGTGKTEIARRIADSASCFFMPLKLPDLKGAHIGESGQNVKAIWEKARARGRCVIFVDECEGVFGRRGSVDTDSYAEDLVQAFLAEWDGMDSEAQQVWVVGATNRRDMLDEAIVQRFGASVEIGLPDAQARLQILAVELAKLDYPPVVPAFVAAATAGYSGRNLADLAKDVGTLADDSSGEFRDDQWRQVLERNAKSRTEKVDPHAHWSSLILAEETLAKLKGVCDALRDIEVLAKQGHKPPAGALLFGPPGTGKTQVARTIANESGLPFIAAKPADLKMGITGHSAQKVRELFERARGRAPCVVFIDELESVAPTRGGPGSDQATNEMVQQILTETEGVGANDRHVYLLGATNLPEQIDPAILSRFDDRIEVPLPDADQRRQLFEVFLARKKTDFDVAAAAAEFAQSAGKIGGRDIVKLIERAGQRAVRRARAAGSVDNVVLSREDLLAELAPPSREVPAADLAKIWEQIVLKPEVKELILDKIGLFNRGDRKAPKGLLLHGPSGTGKTEIARRIADSASCFFMSLKLPDLKGAHIGESGQNVKKVWEKARMRGRCVIFVDECEGVFGRRGSVDTDSYAEELVQAFLAEWDGIDSGGQRVWVIGATNRRDMLDEAIVQRFGAAVEIGLPDAAGRTEILRLELAKNGYAPDVPDFLAQATAGYSGRNLADLVREAGTLADKAGGAITEPMWREVLARHAKAGSTTVADDARWESLVLDADTLETLKTICDSLRHRETLQAQGVEIPRGALLYGPPGTGKTQIARTMANESRLPFLAAATADLKMGHTGQSGQKVRELFERARDKAPCILFIDEMESVAPTRGGPSSDPFTVEIVTQLLQEMDGVRSHAGHVFVLGATNRMDVVDIAVLSRFEEKIRIPNPDAEQRRQIFRLFLAKQKRVDFDVDDLAADLAGRVGDVGGRDIRNLVQRASQFAVRRALKAGRPDQVILAREDFNAALKAPGKPGAA